MISQKHMTSARIGRALVVATALVTLGACAVQQGGGKRGAASSYESGAKSSGSGSGFCQNDRDCKGDRICEKGSCVSPR